MDDIHFDESVYANPTVRDPSRYLPGREEHAKATHGYLGWGSGLHPCRQDRPTNHRFEAFCVANPHPRATAGQRGHEPSFLQGNGLVPANEFPVVCPTRGHSYYGHAYCPLRFPRVDKQRAMDKTIGLPWTTVIFSGPSWPKEQVYLKRFRELRHRTPRLHLNCSDGTVDGEQCPSTEAENTFSETIYGSSSVAMVAAAPFAPPAPWIRVISSP